MNGSKDIILVVDYHVETMVVRQSVGRAEPSPHVVRGEGSARGTPAPRFRAAKPLSQQKRRPKGSARRTTAKMAGFGQYRSI